MADQTVGGWHGDLLYTTNVLQLPLTTKHTNRSHWHHLPYTHTYKPPDNLPLKMREIWLTVGSVGIDSSSKLLFNFNSRRYILLACIPAGDDRIINDIKYDHVASLRIKKM